MKYINSFLSKHCSSELQSLICQSKNPLKEISESYGAYKNLAQFIDIKDEDHSYICIGDGSLSITGAMFAFLTKGKSFSIDPLINLDKLSYWMDYHTVDNFFVSKKRFEEFDAKLIGNKKYTIVCVHAHVNLELVNKKFPNWDYLYTNPCCKRDTQTFTLQYQKENSISCVVCGRDANILSDKNEVLIYKKELS